MDEIEQPYAAHDKINELLKLRASHQIDESDLIESLLAREAQAAAGGEAKGRGDGMKRALEIVRARMRYGESKWYQGWKMAVDEMITVLEEEIASPTPLAQPQPTQGKSENFDDYLAGEVAKDPGLAQRVEKAGEEIDRQLGEVECLTCGGSGYLDPPVATAVERRKCGNCRGLGKLPAKEVAE